MKRHRRNLNECYQVREASVKGYKLHDSHYMVPWERKNYGDSKKILWVMKKQSTDDF